MKKLFISIIVIGLSTALRAQTGSLPSLDKSPMDMSYYPDKYPVLKIQDKITAPLVARIIYSRPQKSGRVIFGGLVKYGEVWRLGANEATEIEFFKHVKIDGKKVTKGRYTLYALVNEDTWTIIINKETNTWGSFKYDSKKDLLRVEVPVQKTDAVVESLSMLFEKTTTGCNLTIAWDNIKVSLPVSF
jgi:Protein of unknown function (DUF2911)